MRHAATRFLGVLLLVATSFPKVGLGGDEGLPDSRMGLRTAPLLLLSRPDVRADLGLDPTQTKAAERAISDLHDKAASVRGQKGEAAIAARRSIDEAQRRWMQEKLTETQRSRLVQIDLQWEGPAALVTRPVVSDALDLLPEQRAALARAVDDDHRRRASNPDPRPDERRLAQQTLAVLSKAQQDVWKRMLGRPHDFQIAAERSNPRR